MKQLRSSPGHDPVQLCIRMPREEREGLREYCRLIGQSVESFTRNALRTATGLSHAAGASTQERAESAVSAPLGRWAGGQR